ncbi:MAG: PAS domain S-box protein, partial [Calditerrivibrio sp.]|nr:PAS domain S-box protein [Calditerrivibrio sp.]
VKYKYFMIFSDITDDLDLKRNSLILHQILENATVEIIITDKNGRIEYVNKSFEEVTGYKYEEAVGKTPAVLKSDYHDAAFYKDLWDTINAGKIWRGKFINKKKNGELYHEKAIIVPLKDFEGNIVKFAAIKEDITDEVEMEKQLLRSQSIETVGKLILPITHDLNNIVTSLNITILNIEKELYNPENIKGILEIQKSIVRKASDFYDKLMKVGKKEKVFYTKIDIYEFLENQKTFFNKVLDDKVEFYLENNLHEFVYGDSVELGQVLLNLLINSKEAIEEKFGSLAGGKVRIKTEILIYDNDIVKFATPSQKVNIKKGSYLAIHVEDNGIGLKPNEMDKVFMPFFSTKPKGTGLGLSTAYNIIKGMSGYIICNSKYTSGTIFTILLPIVKKEDIAYDNKFLPGINILLVDDDETLLHSIESSIKNRGANVFSAHDYWAAVDIISKNDIDVAVIDYKLGEETGLDLYKFIKETYPKIKVILISGYPKDEIKKDPDFNRRFFFLSKPFDTNKLINLIRFVYEIVTID